MPLQVFLVSIVLGKILKEKDKQEKLGKVYIVISAFFSQTGTALIEEFSAFNTNFDELKKQLDLAHAAEREDFEKLCQTVNAFHFVIDSRSGDLNKLRAFLLEKRSSILALFDNPNLLEHDTLTDMLWAIFHVADELCSRDALDGLPDSDLEHLSIDMKRAFRPLLLEWIDYMRHLKKEYPYLFSLALRKNPFSNERSVIVRS